MSPMPMSPKTSSKTPTESPGASVGAIQSQQEKPCENCGVRQPGSAIEVTADLKLCAVCLKPLKRDLPRFDDLGPDAPSFEDYFAKHIDYIKMIQSLMAQALDDHPGVMDQQVREVESHQTTMKSILAWADAYLDMAEHQELAKMPPRDSTWTDLDRSTALAAAVVRQRRLRDVVQGIVESMSARISYAQSRLRAFVIAEGQRFQ